MIPRSKLKSRFHKQLVAKKILNSRIEQPTEYRDKAIDLALLHGFLFAEECTQLTDEQFQSLAQHKPNLTLHKE
jgi:hypothetical protein